MTHHEQLAYLIRQLQQEMPVYQGYPVPEEDAAAFNLFRGLCNVRPPARAPEGFLHVQDELLQTMTAEKGIVDVRALQPTVADNRLCIWQGDITRLRADAIVNAANSRMLGCFQPLHGCIDNMIHTMAGVQLRYRCDQIMRERGREANTSEVIVTPGYNLPARFVLHTVGPIVQSPAAPGSQSISVLTQEDCAALAACYRNCLDAAARNGCSTVAFCGISTGVFGFPKSEAARIAVKTVRRWLDDQDSVPSASSEQRHRVERVIFDVWGDDDCELYRGLLGR
ncbi:MAG: protein-ADP-ribose hydrolase [Eggerthellaceae bacterium]|jgi:O-acetyl-ADP-ribose deacetylase (regulator of RNase III)